MCMYVRVCMYVCVCVCACMYVCMYVCVYQNSPRTFHLDCVNLTKIPSGAEWMCPYCKTEYANEQLCKKTDKKTDNTSEADEHEDQCFECQDVGTLLCCDAWYVRT